MGSLRSALPRRRLIGIGVAAAALAASVTAYTVGLPEQADRSGSLAAEIDPSKPRNVILLIGDGTDDSIITAARNYEHGADGAFPALDALPFTGDMTTHGYKVGQAPDYPIAYVSDSAPTASAWSTGRKTVDGRVSQGPSTAANVPGENYATALEILRDQGKRTGNVSTAELTDATPAAAASHISQRGCQGPANMAACASETKAAGGPGSIAEQLVDNKVDVLLGGGHNRFSQATPAGPSVLEYAASTHGYRYLGSPATISTKADLAAVNSLEDGPVIGLFTPGNMTPRYAPLVASAPPGAGGDEERCVAANRGDQPTLAEMTAKAIELLDNPQGFFLQVESAMVDKQEHAADICGSIGDVAELDQAVQVALDYQAEHPDTLIIVTSDHAHSTQIVPNTGAGRQTATLKTADGDPMHVAYSTQASGSSHTGTQVRVAAKGPQAANVNGLIDQTELFSIMLGRTPSELPTPAPVTVTTPVTVPGPAVTVPGPTTTVTVPGPSVTVPGPVRPAPAGRPQVSLQSPASIAGPTLRRAGLTVVAAAQAATGVRAELRRGNRVLATATLPRRGGSVLLRPRGVVPAGVTVVRITATGKGGTTVTSRTVRVR